MLQAIAIRRDFRSLKARTVITLFPGVNVIVGDQGAGKSTLIELVRSIAASDKMRHSRWRSIHIERAEAESICLPMMSAPMRVIGYDFERDNVRMSPDFQFDDIERQIMGFRASHGQVSMSLLRDIADEAARVKAGEPRMLVMLDEPDSNLSPRSCYEVVRIMRALAAAGHQVIATAHNPILITGEIPGDDTPGWKLLYDLERNDFCKPAEYLAAQAMPAAKTATAAEPVKATKVPVRAKGKAKR